MESTGVVSVLVPCFNAALYIDDALNSVRRQTYPELDIVVVDDGSTDDSPALLRKHAESDRRIRIIGQPNRGLPAARNTALARARGAFVCFLDADDILLPDKIENQLEFLRANPECDLVYSDFYQATTDLNVTAILETRITDPDLLRAFAQRNRFGIMTALVRRSLIDSVGRFDESLRGAEDFDYWVRCAKRGVFGYLPGPVAVYRLHSSQMHTDSKRMFEAGRRVIRKHFLLSPSLYGLAMCCLCWAYAKEHFHAHRYLHTMYSLAASEYYSLVAGGVPLRIRNESTPRRPVASQALAPAASPERL